MAAAEVPIPEFRFNENLTGEEYTNYIDQLTDTLTEERTVRNKTIRVLKCGDRNVGNHNFLTFIPINYRDEIKFRCIFLSTNLYEIGIEVDGKCTVLYGEGYEAYRERGGEDYGASLSSDMEKVKKCLIHKNLDDNPAKCMVGTSYPELERVAGQKRADLVLGKDQLIAAVKYLGTEDLTANLPETCLQVMRVTQMICEPIRIEALARFVATKINQDSEAACVDLLSLEHQWANASKRLISENDITSRFPIYYGDSRDYGLQDDFLYQKYKAIKRYDDTEITKAIANDKRKDSDKSLIYSYLVVCLGKYIKISVPVELGSNLGNQVSVVKTLFKEHLLLHYNMKYASSENVVKLNVDVSEAGKFQKLDNQPVTSIYSNIIFWTYKKQEGDVSLGRFKHTLITKVDDVENTTSLEDLDIILKDYLRRGGFNSFIQAWEGYTAKKVENLKTPNIPLEDARNLVIKLFDMQIEINLKRRSKNQIYLSGKFKDEVDMLVGASFTQTVIGSTNVKGVSNIRLEVRYSDTSQDALFISLVDSFLEEFRALFSQ